MLERIVLYLFYLSKVVMYSNQYIDLFYDFELNYKGFSKICNKVWREPYNYIVFDINNKNINGKLRINWDWSFIV